MTARVFASRPSRRILIRRIALAICKRATSFGRESRENPGGFSCSVASFSPSISPTLRRSRKASTKRWNWRRQRGELRLVNVQPLLPATFMEYVPADFDEEQEKRARDGAGRHRRRDPGAEGQAFLGGRERRRLSRIVARGDGMARRPHRRRLAPARHVGLSARLQRQDDRAPCAMLGAGGARITEDVSEIARASPLPARPA